MRTAFFILMMVVAVFAAMDIIFGDGNSSNTGASTVYSMLGVRPVLRRPDSVYLFLIATVSMVVILIAGLMA